MKKTAAGLLAALAAAPAAHAQEGAARPLSVEVRGGAALPVGAFADGVGTGFTAGAGAAYDLLVFRGARLGVYAGYTYNRFALDDETGLLDDGADYQLAGLDAGVRAALPAVGGVSPWVRGGLVRYQGDITDDAEALPHDAELGLDAAAGIEYPRGGRLSVAPALGYTWIPGQDIADAGFLKLEVGLRARL